MIPIVHPDTKTVQRLGLGHVKNPEHLNPLLGVQHMLADLFGRFSSRALVRSPSPGTTISLAASRAPIENQNRTDSCPGHGTSQLCYTAAKAAGVPDPIRVINLDKAMRHYADINNFPTDSMFTDDEVKQHDAIRQQEMAKAKTDAQAPGAAMAAVNAAKTLSDTQLPGGNSALGAMLGQSGGGAPA